MHSFLTDLHISLIQCNKYAKEPSNQNLYLYTFSEQI